MIASLYIRIKKSNYANYFKTLAIGSILSQFIIFFSSPIITRLYTPEIFGIFVLFITIVSIIAPSASGRYDIAMVVTEENKDGEKLFILSILTSLIISLVIFFLIFFGEIPFKKILNAQNLHNWWFLIPLIIFLHTLVSIVKSYANRNNHYSIISKISVFRAILNTGLIIIFGYTGYTSGGLFIAEIISSILIFIFIYYIYRGVLKKISWKIDYNLFLTAKKFKIFPIYQSTSELCNSLRLLLPIFFLAKYFPEAVVGYYALCFRVIFTPLRFISSSISTIHLKKVSTLISEKKNVNLYLSKLILILLTIILPPSIVLFFYGTEIFAYIFGENWYVAGEYIKILIPGIGLMFVVSTISPVFSSTGNVFISAIWNFASFIIVFLSLFFLAPLLDAKEMMVLITILNCFLYFSYLILIFYAINNPKKIKK